MLWTVDADHKIDAVRRQLVSPLTWAGLAALAGGTPLALAEPEAQRVTSGFTSPVRATVAALADTILPKNLTPGAIEAGVLRYIELTFQRTFDAAAQALFLSGVGYFQTAARRALGMAFTAAPAHERLRYVSALDAECFSAQPSAPAAVVGFVLMVKRLTIIGYYTSDAGAHSELNVELLPGPFRGDVPLRPETRTFYEDSFGVPVERPPGYLARS
jgi:gluconate 2-dehydrogenase gamma chain